MTLYLKYRPQRMADLDLATARETLSKILASGKMPHAWLFTGPRGIGKTSSARILAKAINCMHPDIGGEPCNKCEMCTAITAGSAVDVIEIDAASNRGIDEIRELRDKVKLAPMQAKYKVYIIDEVHMLTTEAANALLKTLEEPPAHTVIMLCTTDPEKLPVTVVSRSTVIQFRKPTLEEISGKLEKVAEGEKIDYDKTAMTAIAKAAKGSFRDGIKLLEQIWLEKGNLKTAAVEEALGILESGEPEKFVELILSGKTELAIELINTLAEQGRNLRGFTETTAEVLRSRMLEQVKKGKVDSQVMELLKAVETAYERLKTAVVPQLPLEIMAVETTTGKLSGNEQKTKEQEIKTVEIIMKKEEKTAEKPEEKKEEIKSSGKGKFNVADLESKWQEILKAVKPKNHSVEALLRSTKPTEFDGDAMTLEVFYKFHKDKLETEKCRVIVENAVGEVFGTKPIKLKLKLGQKLNKKEEVSAEGVGEDILKAAEEIFKVEAI